MNFKQWLENAANHFDRNAIPSSGKGSDGHYYVIAWSGSHWQMALPPRDRQRRLGQVTDEIIRATTQHDILALIVNYRGQYSVSTYYLALPTSTADDARKFFAVIYGSHVFNYKNCEKFKMDAREYLNATPDCPLDNDQIMDIIAAGWIK